MKNSFGCTVSELGRGNDPHKFNALTIATSFASLHIRTPIKNVIKMYIPALILLSTLSATSTADENIRAFHPTRLLTRQDFSKILYRAVDEDAMTFQHLHVYSKARQLRQWRENKVWGDMLQHGWAVAKHRSKNRILRSENNFTSHNSFEITHTGQDRTHPFLLCSSYPYQSGYVRLQRILSAFNASMSMSQTIYNTEESSCFVVVTTSEVVEQTLGESNPVTGETRTARTSTGNLMENVTFGPLVDVLKFAAGTPTNILNDDDWIQPLKNTKPSLRSGMTSAKLEQDEQRQHHWTRSFMVDLIPGSNVGMKSGYEGVESIAKDIMDNVAAMADVKPTMNFDQMRSKRKSIGVEKSFSDTLSTREAFSLTSSTVSLSNIKTRAFRYSDNVWSNALTNGFESDHGCRNMFELIKIRPRGGVDETDNDTNGSSISVVGFELFLNVPLVVDEETVNSSAWNKNCAISLIMGLSVHPLVQTIELARKLELASASGTSNPQWITQSASVNSRPFFDKGLDGSGQVVAVADGGLDRDNCYFRDATSDAGEDSIFGSSWDMTQRKIVNYDNSFADQEEIYMGHGTHVSGIIAGKKSSNGLDEEIGYADGVAPGSKLSFFDMELGANGIEDPGASRLFASFYNSGDGAYIMNGSWGRSYKGVYNSFCRDYDSLLRSTYSNVLFVVSAGNTGIEGIQNPSDCKNTFAVGASLSYGKDIRSREKGIEYLADYSSRGPTSDGRIKPDIVAPGHFILAPNAGKICSSHAVVPSSVELSLNQFFLVQDPNKFGECDGSSVPNVQDSLSAGSGAKYVSGTSMSSPVVAGSASIVRQYFEEGWCGTMRCCGTRGCGVAIKPSGSLLKAILMNGAQPLTGGIQSVPDGDVLRNEPLSEYDSNQGMGRLNLLYSLPLTGENNVGLIIVNDKAIANAAEHDYLVDIDTSNGCNSDLRVTLAWYDAPGAVGCTNCLMNDLDLFVEEVNRSEMFYPNGLSYRDTKNTVERIRVS